MFFGNTLVLLAALSTLAAAWLFLSCGRTEARLSGQNRRRGSSHSPRLVRKGALGLDGERSIDRLRKAGQRLATVACLFVAAASIYLACLITTHQFQFNYVADYSSRRSEAQYLLAAFWGGQEGSILLWALWTSLLGVVLAWKANGAEARVWPIFAIVQCLLLALVLVKSPFTVSSGPAPADGQGLNPLLENQWMIIHPPILFLGFASLALPWTWAMYGLIYKDWDGWLRGASPWMLFAFSVHGLGIALGGYWAYETLGWGGFWGWDPVENSSLVPWLFLIGALHGAYIQRTTGGFRVATFLLAALPFAFMSYGTFLTRTGVLADFSVHSFSSLGRGGFAVLLSEIGVALVLPLGLLGTRYRQLPRGRSRSELWTRENVLFLTTIVLAAMALLTAIGMSAPLITKLWIAKGAAVQPEYYNEGVYPLAVLMLVLMAVSPFIRPRAGRDEGSVRRAVVAYAGTLALTILFFAVGGRKPWMLLLFGASAFVVILNLQALIDRARRSGVQISTGAIVAHGGAALLIAGVACLVALSRQFLHLTLIKGQPTTALGYTLTYLGETSQPYDRSNALRIRVQKGGQAWYATPHVYIAPWSGSDQLFANPPDIHNGMWGDLYIAHYRGPSSLSFVSPENGMTLSPGDTVPYGAYRFTYHGLRWSDDSGQPGSVRAMDTLTPARVSATVDVTYNGKTYPIQPVLVFDQDRMSKYAIPAALPGASHAVIALNDVRMPDSATLTTSNLPDPMEMVQVDVSTKPMIGLVWAGTILYTLGGLLALRRRQGGNTLPDPLQSAAISSENPPDIETHNTEPEESLIRR